MEKILTIIDSILERTWHPIRRKILGANNENIEFLLDSFSRLSSEQRLGLIAGSGVALVLGAIIILGIYFSALSSLDEQLSQSFEAKHRLNFQMQNYAKKKGQYDALKLGLERKLRGLRTKAFFEGVANQRSVTMRDLNESKAPIDSSNLLAKQFQSVKVQIRLTKISLPRLIKFMSEIERSEKYFTVEDLRIRGRFGTKLYFDAEAKFSGLAPL